MAPKNTYNVNYNTEIKDTPIDYGFDVNIASNSIGELGSYLGTDGFGKFMELKVKLYLDLNSMKEKIYSLLKPLP